MSLKMWCKLTFLTLILLLGNASYYEVQASPKPRSHLTSFLHRVKRQDPCNTVEEFQCKKEDGNIQCIAIEKKCDGVQDCEFNEDESDCTPEVDSGTPEYEYNAWTPEYEDYEEQVLPPFGYCNSENKIPAHGPNNDGCCMNSESGIGGCCPDFINVYDVEDKTSCSCNSTEFGCCPDGKKTARGPENLGCGCAFSEFGCCFDQVTEAIGLDQEGCPCHTMEFGCCPDGETNAEGSSLEGCEDCSTSEFGCCPDQFTYATGLDGLGCDCAGSAHGCCTDGQTPANGPEFEGCGEIPGQQCNVPKVEDNFSCSQGQTIKWWFDMKESGGCSRKWVCPETLQYSPNTFDTELECESTCVNPQGSGKCYLPKMTGSCQGEEKKFYFDKDAEQCKEFQYGGCLGNMNRFETMQECQESCLGVSDDVAICSQPYEPGPCRGSYERWYFDKSDGFCKSMNYTGCLGNKNRFMTKEACDNSCKHEVIRVQSQITCSLPKVVGQCLENEAGPKAFAKWYFDRTNKVCQPFYFSGCGGNENNFDTREECETTCPNTFPPEIQVDSEGFEIELGNALMLAVHVEANPEPTITWQHNGTEKTFDDRIKMLENGSVQISDCESGDSGTWTILATNILGQKASKQMTVDCHPDKSAIEVEIDRTKTVFSAGEDVKLFCTVRGYPVPKVEWRKNHNPLPTRGKFRLVQDNQDYNLILTNVTQNDRGDYSCRARNRHETVSETIALIIEKRGSLPQCNDMPEFAKCSLLTNVEAVKHFNPDSYCNDNYYYSKFCCKSCTEAGLPLHEDFLKTMTEDFIAIYNEKLEERNRRIEAELEAETEEEYYDDSVNMEYEDNTEYF